MRKGRLILIVVLGGAMVLSWLFVGFGNLAESDQPSAF